MKTFARFLPILVALVSPFLMSAALLAQDSPTVSVAKTIPDLTVAAGTGSSTVKLKKTFALSGTPGDVVRFSTQFGSVDVQLNAVDAPQTVANFLGYVNRGNYNNTFLHRSVPGFIVQGGGYSIANDNVQTVPEVAPVVNEFKTSNTRGTIAMAKLGGDPNSATNQWFFNLADNSGNLDNQNGGFTVFGTVLGNGMSVVDTIAALQVVNAGSPFDQLPVLDTFTGSVSFTDLVYLNSVSVLPLLPKVTGDPALLKLKVFSNSNPGLVTPVISGSKLKLTYASGATGTATITLQAKGTGKGVKARTSFNVTVQ